MRPTRPQPTIGRAGWCAAVQVRWSATGHGSRQWSVLSATADASVYELDPDLADEILVDDTNLSNPRDHEG